MVYIVAKVAAGIFVVGAGIFAAIYGVEYAGSALDEATAPSTQKAA